MSLPHEMVAMATVLAVFVGILLALLRELFKGSRHRVAALAVLLVGVTVPFVVVGWRMEEESPTKSTEISTTGDEAGPIRTEGEYGEGQDSRPDPPATDKTVETQATARLGQDVTKPEVPIRFTLNDGEQRVFLEGQASVGLEFSRVGSMNVATLRLFGDEGGQTHAMLVGGKRYRVEVGGIQYFVTVTELDFESREAEFQVDRKTG